VESELLSAATRGALDPTLIRVNTLCEILFQFFCSAPDYVGQAPAAHKEIVDHSVVLAQQRAAKPQMAVKG
jgi:hypothetical protein